MNFDLLFSLINRVISCEEITLVVPPPTTMMMIKNYLQPFSLSLTTTLHSFNILELIVECRKELKM